MKKLKLILLFSALLFATQNGKAQIPSNDAAWIKIDSLSEDFDSLALRPSKWDYNDGFQTDGADISYKKNAVSDTFGSGHLTLVVDTLKPNVHVNYPATSKGLILTNGATMAYQSGRVSTKSTSYKYGYIEIYAKYPKGRLFEWPAFFIWNWNTNCSNLSNTWYNEVDITENGGDIAKAGNLGTGIGVNRVPLDTCGKGFNNTTQHQIDTLVNIDTLTVKYHKYALQWDSDRLIFYYDDVPFRTANIPHDTIPTHGMEVILFNQVFPWNVSLPSDWNRSPNPLNLGDITYPYYLFHRDTVGFNFPNSARELVFDYLHYYKLGTECDSAFILTGCNTSLYNRKVKKSIKITTGTSCSTSYSPSTHSASYTLRATDYVLLDIPATGQTITINPTSTGSDQGYFAIEIMPCPN
jgi:beta-glucanase (GH16 family)